MFTQLTGKQGLTYFFKDEFVLRDVVTTKTDKKKKINRQPTLVEKDIAPSKYFVTFFLEFFIKEGELFSFFFRF